MTDEQHNFQVLSSVLDDIGKDIIQRFLNKKLQDAKTNLQTVLTDERHTFYHAFKKEECCKCNHLRNKTNAYMFKEQWKNLYVGGRPPCKRHKNCSCRYDVVVNVTTSAFDITLCSSLLLTLATRKVIHILSVEENHIKRICEHRNRIKHSPSKKITESSFTTQYDDMTVSIIELAHACSLQLAEQTKEKIRLEKVPLGSYKKMLRTIPEGVQCNRLENKRDLTIETSVTDAPNVIRSMNTTLASSFQQTVPYSIDQIRARLSLNEYKTRIVSDLDVTPTIDYLKRHNILSTTDTDYLNSNDGRSRRSEELMRIILSKDDTIVNSFMASLLDTEQNLIHDFIKGNEYRGKLRLIFEVDVPLQHPVGENVFFNITMKDRREIQSKVLDILLEEEVDVITRRLANLSLYGADEGSIIIHLRTESVNAIHNAYNNGNLHKLIEEIFERAGVLKQLIHDQVTVVVKITSDETKKEPSAKTFYEMNWEYLVEEISPRPVANLLFDRGVLDISDLEEIFHSDNLTRFSQSNALITKLNTKANKTVVDFKQCLSLTSHGYVLKNLRELVAADENQESETASSFCSERGRLNSTEEMKRKQRLCGLLVDGGSQALRYIISRIVLGLINVDGQTRAQRQLCKKDKNLLYPAGLELPSLDGLSHAGLNMVWTKALQQSPVTSATAQNMKDMIYDYLVSDGLDIQLKNNKQRVQELNNEKQLLSKEQWDILYPRLNASVDLESFDMTLLCFVILDVFQFTPTSGIWSQDPPAGDVDVGDDILRLRTWRNKLTPSSSSGIDNSTFKTAWTEIRDILLRLKPGQDFSDKIQHLHDCQVDPGNAAKNDQLIEDWISHDTQLGKVESDTSQIQKCLTETRKEIHENTEELSADNTTHQSTRQHDHSDTSKERVDHSDTSKERFDHSDTSKERFDLSDTSQERVDHSDTSQERVDHSDTSQERVDHSDTSKERFDHSDTSKERFDLSDTSQERVDHSDTSQERVDHSDTSQERVDHSDTSKERFDHSDTSKERFDLSDTSQERVDHSDTLQERVDHSDISKERFDHSNTSKERDDHSDTSKERVDHSDTSQERVDHSDTSQERFDHSDTSKERFDHSDTSKERVDHSDTSQERVDHSDTSQERVDHSDTSKERFDHSDTSKERVDHSDTSKERVDHSDTFQERVDHSDTFQERVDHSDTSKERVYHSDTSKERVDHSDTSQESVDHSDTSKERFDLSDTSKESVDHSDTSKERFDHSDTSKERFDLSDTSQERVDHSDTSKESVDHSDTSKERFDHSDTSKERFDLSDTSQERVDHSDTLQERVDHSDISKERFDHSNTSKERDDHSDTSKERVDHSDTSQERVDHSDTSKERVDHDETFQERVDHGDTSQERVDHSDTSKERVDHVETSKERVDNGETFEERPDDTSQDNQEMYETPVEGQEERGITESRQSGTNGEPFLRPETTLSTSELNALHHAQYSVGLISIMDSTKKIVTSTGTGFVVGDGHLMTACHVINEQIEDILQTITQIVLSEDSDFERWKTDFLGLEEMEPYAAVKGYYEKSKTNLDVLISSFEEYVTKEDYLQLKQVLDRKWHDEVTVEFENKNGTKDKYTFSPNIPFLNENIDVAILKIQSYPGRKLPESLPLMDSSIHPEKVNIFGYIRKKIRIDLALDPKCEVYTKSSNLAKNVAEAINWWKEKEKEIDNRSEVMYDEIDFEEGYKDCVIKDSEVLLHASPSFVHGTSGSPMIDFEEIGTTTHPVVVGIYLRGYPKFYYKIKKAIENRNRLTGDCRHFNKLRELVRQNEEAQEMDKIIKMRYFIEAGTTMKNLADNLPVSDMRDMLFPNRRTEAVGQLRLQHLVMRPHQSSMGSNIVTVASQTCQEEDRPAGQSIADNRPKVMQATVKSWRQEKLYKTKGVTATREKILSQHCVCVVGVPGAGKSTAIHHAALCLEDNGFIIYCIHDSKELREYFDEDKKQVFILDDVLGIYSLDQGKVKLWDENNDNITGFLGTNTKLLVSIRTQLYNQAVKGNNFVFLDKSTCIDISDDTYRLDTADMMGMLRHYLTVQGVDKVDDLIGEIFGYSDKYLQDMTEKRRQREMPWSYYTREFREFSHCFPLLCKMFCSEEILRHKPREFFTNPFQALTQIFQKIKSDNKLQFCGLILCAVFDGKLTEDMFSIDCEYNNECDVNLRDVIMKAFHLEGHLLEIKSALNSLDGVYVTRVVNTYQMSHRVFHDVVTYLFNDTDPSFVLKYGTREFIRDRIRLSKTQLLDPYMIIINDDKNIQRLADRLIRELMSDTVTGARFIIDNTNIGDERLFSYLIRKLSNIAQTHKQQINELFIQCMEALYHNDKDTYKLIVFCLQSGVDCNVKIGGGYPLHLSAEKGSVELTQLLLQHGADKRRVDVWGDSVLHCVCNDRACRDSKHRLDIIKLLTQDGDLSGVQFITSDRRDILQILEGDIDSIYEYDRDKRRELLEALDSDNVQLEEVLSDHSITVLTTDKHQMKDYVEHSEGKIQLVRRVHDNILTHVNDEGRNILHYSVDDYDLTKYLLQCGADKRRVDSRGDSVLHYVCRDWVCRDSKHRLDIIKLLTQDGDLPGIKFITSNRRRILQILADDIDSVYRYNRDRQREILEALDSGNVQLEEVLSDHSIKVLTTDKHKMKDYVEHSEGKIQLVRHIHDNILTHEDRWGRNILHYSVDDYDVTEYLLQRGADKRRVDMYGDSVLHRVYNDRVCSDSKHRLDIIKLLTQDGDLSVVDFITSDRRRILQILEGDINSYKYYRDRRELLEALDSGNVQLEEVLSDHSITVLTTDKHQMKDYVKRSEGKIQLVRRVHDNILTHVDGEGRNILHNSVDDYNATKYLLRFQCFKLEINRCDRYNRTPYWYVMNDKKPDVLGGTENVVIENKEDMKKLYIKHGAVLCGSDSNQEDSYDDSSEEDSCDDSSEEHSCDDSSEEEKVEVIYDQKTEGT